MATRYEIKRLAGRKADKYRINRRYFQRQIKSESNYQEGRSSPAGATGVAQIMPATARGWGVNPNNAGQALDAAAKHMAEYLRSYHGDWRKALAAYNAGPGAVQKYGGVPPYAETRNYIAKILSGGSPTRGADGGGGASTFDKQGVKITEKNVLDKDAFEQAKRGYVLGTLLSKRHGTSGPLFKAGLVSTEQPSEQSFMRSVLSSKITHDEQAVPGAKSGDAPNSVGRALRIAVAQSDRRLPYRWGGGHGSSPASVGTPVDCSGYWSQILGVSPRVSGQFAKFGAPGKGKYVTIYAHNSHVLGSIRDPRTGKVRWFATSRSNPGGGAGEISKPSASYLRAFSVRHPRGL